MNRIFRAAALAALSIGAIMASGCATTSSTKQPQAVEDRAVKRWELLIAGKADEAYEYLTAGYRETHAKDPYITAMTHRPVKWKSVKYMDKTCDDTSCTVRVLLTYSLVMGPATPRPVDAVSVENEKWIKSATGWYHLPRD